MGEEDKVAEAGREPFDIGVALSKAAAAVADGAAIAAGAVGDVAGAAREKAEDAIGAAGSFINDAVDSLEDGAREEIERDERAPVAHVAPTPVIDAKEEHALEILTERYERMLEPGVFAKAGEAIGGLLPEAVKDAAGDVADAVKGQWLYEQAMNVIMQGFRALEEQAARFSLGPNGVLAEVNKVLTGEKVISIDELCLLRSYEVARVVHGQKWQHLGLAFVEGAATGAPGFAGLPFNLALSTFLYYRTVQTIALFYGYDVKNSPEELVIASEVFVNAMAPGDGRADGVGAAIGKVMMVGEMQVVKQTVKKGWTAMAQRGGLPLIIAQMRALAHGAARKALEKAGAKGLENSAFRGVFEQIGKRLGQKAVGKAVPVVGAAMGALFDTGQMNAVLEYADLFYQKRFILEKEYRVGLLLGEMAPEIVLDEIVGEE